MSANDAAPDLLRFTAAAEAMKATIAAIDGDAFFAITTTLGALGDFATEAGLEPQFLACLHKLVADNSPRVFGMAAALAEPKGRA